MKHRFFLCALLLSALLLAGCAQEQSQLSYIGADTAKTLALEAAGLPASGVQFTSMDMGSRNGMDYYQVNFTAGDIAYSYAIDALTGTVLEAQADPPAEGGAALPVASAPQAGPSPDQTVPTGAQPAASDRPVSGAVSSGSSAGGMISLEDAKAAALTHAGLTSGQVTFVESKLDYDDGRQVYEVEFCTQDYKEYDYEIDAYTGEILSYDYDAEYYTSPASGGAAITAEEAKALALAQVPGAASGDITEFETDYDDGRIEYEGKILYNGMEYEFEIDGYSCAFRSWEVECVNHDAHHGIHH